MTPKITVRNADNAHLSALWDLDPVFRRILAARGVESLEQIDYRLKNILPLDAIRNLSEAASLLSSHIQQSHAILVFGDYDADGATSTALCIRALNLMGFHRVDYLMPDRFIDGYGLSLSAAERIAGKHPDCVITVDNGVASFDGIALLRQAGIDVIVTDHHLPGDRLPEASVIVNQNAWPQEMRGRHLAGVGVAFYLMLALRSQLRQSGWFTTSRAEPNLASCLDLVAVGSIADLVPLDYTNRILVQQGLKRIQAGACCEGVKALVSVADRTLDNFNSSDIAFALAPRVNAAGRLDDMTVGVQCLLAESSELAMNLAMELDNINRYRRDLQQQMAAEADQQLAGLDQKSVGRRKTIVLFKEDWHEGVVGIVASKLKEKYGRPSIVLAKAEDGLLKGSGRSISGIHLRDVLDAVDKRIPGHIIKFGGHAMAAGLTLESDSLKTFMDSFEAVIDEIVDPACFNQEIQCDGELDRKHFNLQFASDLSALGPWGQGFPTPSFIGEFEVINQRVLKQQHLKLTLLTDEQTCVDAIAFFQTETALNREYETIKLHYELSVNRFRDMESVQLLIRDIL